MATKMKKNDADARAKARRYQNLLQDYLELQKEFVSKKKQREYLKNKRAALKAEVRFLRRRYQQLLQVQADNRKLLDFHAFKSSDISQLQDSKQLRASEQLVGKTYLTTDLHPILASVLKEGRGVPAPREFPLPPYKKAKTCTT